MSWVKTNTYNLIDRFQVRTRQEIYKFHQINSTFNDYSESIWIQSERDELNYQIKSMFDEMKEWLGFFPRPIWKKIKIPLDYYYPYFSQELKVPESAWLNDLGIRATEVVSLNASYISNDDLVTMSITTDEIESGEIHIFHTAEDSFGNVADERFRILPSNMYYDGTKYQITIPKARLIKPEKWLYEFTNGDPLNRLGYDKGDSGNFSQKLDVYRVYNDNAIQGKLIGPPLDYTTSSAIQSQTVSVTILDSYDSKFKIQGQTSVLFEPTHIELWCHIGHPLTEQGLMNPIIEEFIIRKARVEMGINARLAEAKISTQWSFDDLPAYTKPDSNSGRVGIGYRPNSIGARNVDLEMFKKLFPIADVRGKILSEREWAR